MNGKGSLDNEIQLKEEIRKRDNLIDELKEQLEYFTDKYGLPDNFNTIDVTDSIASNFKNPEKVISDEAKHKEAEDNIVDLHQRLVTSSVHELLKIQLSDLMLMLSDHNKNTIQIYNAIQALKDKLKEVNKKN